MRESVSVKDDNEFWEGEGDKDGVLGIVSPHHKHIQELKDEISMKTGMDRNDLYIGTVDNLQGQQREVVIVSYGVTDLEASVIEGEFIFNRNRLNVALTRAKCKTIVLFSEILTEPPADLMDTEDEDIQKGIEFVCGFHEFMSNNEAGENNDIKYEYDRRDFPASLKCGSRNTIEIYKKRMKRI